MRAARRPPAGPLVARSHSTGSKFNRACTGASHEACLDRCSSSVFGRIRASSRRRRAKASVPPRRPSELSGNRTRSGFTLRLLPTPSRCAGSMLTISLGIGPTGVVRNKSEVVADFTSHALTYQSITTSDVLVRVYGNTAVETGRSTMVGQDRGKTVPRDNRFTRVWVMKDGRWQLVANHYSLLTTP